MFVCLFWVWNIKFRCPAFIAELGKTSCLEITGQSCEQNAPQNSPQYPIKEKNLVSQTSNQERTKIIWNGAFYSCRKSLLRDFCSPVVWRDWKLSQTDSRGIFFTRMGIGIELEETVLYHLLPSLVQRRGKGQECRAPLLAAWFTADQFKLLPIKRLYC